MALLQEGATTKPNLSELLPVQMLGVGSGPTTGVSRYARSLAAALQEAGVAVDLSLTTAPPVPAALVRLARRVGFDLGSFFNTYPLKLARPAGDGLLHLTSQGQASLLAFGPRRPRTVVTVHDLITTVGRADPELAGYMRFYDRRFDDLSRRGLERAAMLIADSEHTRRDILRHLNYPPERVKVVYIGVDGSIFRPGPVSPDLYERYHLHPNAPYLLYAGSEDPRKNLRRLFQAFARVLTEWPQARLIKVGAARFQAERTELLTYAEQLGLGGKILFVEQVSEAALVQFYNLARVFVFPSLYEGFGLPPLEALACGCPVVCSNRTALPEVVGEAALLVNPYEVEEIAAAIGRILADKDLQTSLRERGFVQAAKFTWQAAAAQTLEVYRQVLTE